VGDEIERIATIVRRMRDFYRPAREGLQPTHLDAVLESVLELTSKQLQHSQVTVERMWADYIPEIQTNPDHLKQVFLNLILNAVDAMPTGGTLYISTDLDQVQGGDDQQSAPAVRIEFSDTGEGMPPEVVSRLFEPFFTTKESGTGLGLSVSYGIIQAHNGQITVESHPGMGTIFTILLPVEQPPPS
jgi:two-component system NtrC family sensor kinase